MPEIHLACLPLGKATQTPEVCCKPNFRILLLLSVIPVEASGNRVGCGASKDARYRQRCVLTRRVLTATLRTLTGRQPRSTRISLGGNPDLRGRTLATATTLPRPLLKPVFPGIKLVRVKFV